MSVKSKLILIISLSFIVFYTAIVVIIVELVHERSEDYYREWVVNKKDALEKIIEEEFSSLLEGYYYINVYNISPEVLISTHDYTSVVYYSSYGQVERIVKNQNSDFKMDDAIMLSSSVKPENGIKKGFCYHQGKLYMFLSFPKKQVGSKDGYIAVVKEIDQEYLNEIRYILSVDVVEFFEKKKEVEGEVSDYLTLKSSDNKIIGYLRVGYRNVIDPLVIKTYYFAIVLMGIVLLATIFSTTYLLDRVFLRKISVLSTFMKNIGKRGFRTGERIIMAGDDELKELSDSINLALDEIERSEREISGMAENLRVINRILRHDILNDLTVIRGFAEVASEKHKCDFCPRIMGRAEKAVETIKKLKNVEEALSESELYPMRVSEVLRDVLKVYDIEWEIEGDAVVLADDGLYSIFDNLVSNSVKHGKTDRIKFEIKEEDGKAIIKVIDYGEGIPDSIKQRIFEEGFTLGDGSGLGLYIVKKLIEKYGGNIAVTDNRPSGTIFTIKLKTGKQN